MKNKLASNFVLRSEKKERKLGQVSGWQQVLKYLN